jgi:hypothetical protein
MAFSPQVTKLSFGMNDDDDDSDFPRPILTVVMPTDALITMVRDLIDVMGSDAFKEDMIAKTGQMAEYFSLGLDRPASGQMFRVGRDPEPAKPRKKAAR